MMCLLVEVVAVPVPIRPTQLAPRGIRLSHAAHVRRECMCFLQTLSALRSHSDSEVARRRLQSPAHKKHIFPALESASRALSANPEPDPTPDEALWRAGSTRSDFGDPRVSGRRDGPRVNLASVTRNVPKGDLYQKGMNPSYPDVGGSGLRNKKGRAFRGGRLERAWR